MPLGIISEDDFDKELARLGLAVPKKVEVEIIQSVVEPESKADSDSEATIVDIKRGRGKGDIEVPDALRALIGQSAIEGNRNEARAIARAFGLSDSSVSAYSNGATSTASYNEPSARLKGKLDETRNLITGKAKSKLLSALDNITDDKLANAKLRDISATAQAMSAIVRNLETPNEISGQTVNVVVYAPKMRGEEAFEVIDVRE